MMKNLKGGNVIDFLKKHKLLIIVALIFVIVIIRIIFGPKTVAYGNGYFHQVGSFGECDMNFEDCMIDATHRQHHFFGNEDYCDACWDSYGQDMFERLSGKKSDSNSITYDEYKCRHTGCKNRAKYSEWDRRYCAEHLQGTKYCRYPNCGEQIPIDGLSDYCSKHR